MEIKGLKQAKGTKVTNPASQATSLVGEVNALAINGEQGQVTLREIGTNQGHMQATVTKAHNDKVGFSILNPLSIGQVLVKVPKNHMSVEIRQKSDPTQVGTFLIQADSAGAALDGSSFYLLDLADFVLRSGIPAADVGSVFIYIDGANANDQLEIIGSGLTAPAQPTPSQVIDATTSTGTVFDFNEFQVTSAAGVTPTLVGGRLSVTSPGALSGGATISLDFSKPDSTGRPTAFSIDDASAVRLFSNLNVVNLNNISIAASDNLGRTIGGTRIVVNLKGVTGHDVLRQLNRDALRDPAIGLDTSHLLSIGISARGDAIVRFPDGHEEQQVAINTASASISVDANGAKLPQAPTFANVINLEDNNGTLFNFSDFQVSGLTGSTTTVVSDRATTTSSGAFQGAATLSLGFTKPNALGQPIPFSIEDTTIIRLFGDVSVTNLRYLQVSAQDDTGHSIGGDNIVIWIEGAAANNNDVLRQRIKDALSAKGVDTSRLISISLSARGDAKALLPDGTLKFQVITSTTSASISVDANGAQLPAASVPSDEIDLSNIAGADQDFSNLQVVVYGAGTLNLASNRADVTSIGPLDATSTATLAFARSTGQEFSLNAVIAKVFEDVSVSNKIFLPTIFSFQSSSEV